MLRTLRTVGAVGAFWTVRALGALWPLRVFWTIRTLWAIWPLEARVKRRRWRVGNRRGAVE